MKEPNSITQIFVGMAYPAKKYQPNWDSEKDYLRCYSEFIEVIGAKSPGACTAITPEEYASHLCFYAVSFCYFDLL